MPIRRGREGEIGGTEPYARWAAEDEQPEAVVEHGPPVSLLGEQVSGNDQCSLDRRWGYDGRQPFELDRSLCVCEVGEHVARVRVALHVAPRTLVDVVDVTVEREPILEQGLTCRLVCLPQARDEVAHDQRVATGHIEEPTTRNR